MTQKRRRAVSVASFLASGLLTATVMLSIPFTWGFTSRNSWGVACGGGGVAVIVGDIEDSGFPERLGLHGERRPLDLVPAIVIAPPFSSSGRSTILQLPLIPFIIIALLPGLRLLRLSRARELEYRCTGCGYPRPYPPTPTCPECGEATPLP